MPAHNSIEETGNVYGRLTVLERAGRNSERKTLWLCRCSCGKEKNVTGKQLRGGQVVSCGCYMRTHAAKTFLKHGFGSTKDRVPEYESWSGMIQRCTNPKNAKYPRYGGRGITVCDRWRGSFEFFLSDMGFKPTPAHSIDRKDNDGNYDPDNCRWAIPIEQARNTSRNRRYDFGGKLQTPAEAVTETSISLASLKTRLERGWDPLDAKFLGRQKPGPKKKIGV